VVVSWEIIAVSSAAAAGLGAAVDRLLLESQRMQIYDWALDRWLRLSNAKLSDLPSSAALLILRRSEAFARSALRLSLLTLPISTVLTALAAIIGRVELDAARHPDHTALPLDDRFAIQVDHYVRYVGLGHYVPALLTNWLFDSMTLVVFFRVLRMVQRSPNTGTRLSALASGVLFATVLAFACLICAHFTTVATSGPYYDHDIGSACLALWHFLTFQIGAQEASYYDDVGYAVSTLVPIVAFTTWLLVLLIAKLMVSAALGISLHGLRLIADTHPAEVRSKLSPFLLVGTLFGILSIISKAVIDLAKAFAH
jgi:hypothetical protein